MANKSDCFPKLASSVFRIATIYLMWNSKTFPWLSRTFLRKSKTTKTWKFYIFFKNKLYYSALLNWLIPENEKTTRSLWTKIRPCKMAIFVLQRFRIKNILIANSIFISFLKVKKETFWLFQNFQGPRSKLKYFSGPGIFFPQFQDFLGFSRTVATLNGLRLNSVHWILDMNQKERLKNLSLQLISVKLETKRQNRKRLWKKI